MFAYTLREALELRLAPIRATLAILGSVNRAAIAVVDEYRSPLSSRIILAFYPPYFTMPRLISQHDMDVRMDSGLGDGGFGPEGTSDCRHGWRQV